jgi:hypothetical protein
MSCSKSPGKSSRLDRERICKIYADLAILIDQVGTDPNLHFLETARNSLADAIFALPLPTCRSSVISTAFSSDMGPGYIESASVPPLPVSERPLPTRDRSDVPTYLSVERELRPAHGISPNSMTLRNQREFTRAVGDFRTETAKPTMTQENAQQSTYHKATSDAPFVPNCFNRLSARMWKYSPKPVEDLPRWKELMKICDAENIIEAASVKLGRSLIATSPNFMQMTDTEFDRWYRSPARVEWVRMLINTSNRIQEVGLENAGYSCASNTSPAQPLTARTTTKLNHEDTRFGSKEGVSRSSDKAPVGSLSKRIDALIMQAKEELRIANERYSRLHKTNSCWLN